MLRLKDKVAIVTGGSKGIGKAIVEGLTEEGCRVAFTYKEDKQAAEALQSQTRNRAIAYGLDVRDFDKTKKLVNDVKERFAGLDLLVNNAGIARDKALMMMEDKDWHEVIDTNLTGTYNATRACIVTFMKQKRGCIINISSVAGIIGLPGQTNYAASKAGIIGFTKALAKEVGRYNVRVNAIAPGFIQTEMLGSLVEKKKEQFIKWIPLARFGMAKEVAELVIFLAGPQAGYITGEVIRIDGGLSI